MNAPSKIVSLLILASLSSGITAEKLKHEKKPHRKKECCSTDSFDRSFEIKLSFEQELVAAASGEVTYVPRPASDAPNGTHGKIEICFAKDLSSLRYKLFVFNALGEKNPNERITMAHFHAGRASQNGPVIAFLFDAGNGFRCGEPTDGLLAKGRLTNADIIPVVSPDGNEYNSIASLIDGIRRGDVYVNVHGSNRCSPRDTGYASGIIRGQVLTEETSG